MLSFPAFVLIHAAYIEQYWA